MKYNRLSTEEISLVYAYKKIVLVKVFMITWIILGKTCPIMNIQNFRCCKYMILTLCFKF